MIAVDLLEGQLYHDREIKDRTRRRRAPMANGSATSP